jgi:hypothetical protein
MILNYLLLLGLTGPHFYNGLGFVFLYVLGLVERRGNKVEDSRSVVFSEVIVNERTVVDVLLQYTVGVPARMCLRSSLHVSSIFSEVEKKHMKRGDSSDTETFGQRRVVIRVNYH